MNILFDIIHPADVWFFKHPMRILKERGHRIVIASREKDVTIDLLNAAGYQQEIISRSGGGIAHLACELVRRDWALCRLARRERADVLVGLGGPTTAHAGKLTGIPSCVFYDLESARLQNCLTYPFATRVHVPECYSGWIPAATGRRFSGYKELSYLHPKRFSPDRRTALANGILEDRENFFLRVVSWHASHDIGKHGWSSDLLRSVVRHLDRLGHVIISSERLLPAEFEAHLYTGDPQEIHHVLAHSRFYVGESMTMATEAAVLGVPAICATPMRSSYIRELEQRYGLVRSLQHPNWPNTCEAIQWALDRPVESWGRDRDRMLGEKTDVAAYVADAVEELIPEE